MDIERTLRELTQQQASDIFIVAGSPLKYRLQGEYFTVGQPLMPGETKALIMELYRLANRPTTLVLERHDDDFSFSIVNVGRYRVNAFWQRGSMAAVLRVVSFHIPNAQQLNIIPPVLDLAKLTKGLVLVTGPAGSGKSTTLACLIDRINKSRAGHIITLEDPLEYLHRHDQCIVSQREISLDTESYASGLRAALREAPTVILLGEMRDYETISIAMSAAETGQLIFSTLHTLGAANTIDRIVDVFPPNQQQQVRVQLSMVLQAVVSQQLIPTVNDELVPVFEVVLCTPAIRNLIRESKMHQLNSMMQASANQGMIGMDASLIDLYKRGVITAENALTYCLDADSMKKKLAAAGAVL